MEKRSLVPMALGLALGATAASAAVPGSLKAPDFSLSGKESRGSIELVAAAPPSHHFNLQAPMRLEIEGSDARLKPMRATEKEVLFRAPGTGSKSVRVSLFICDDQKTFCEKHTVGARWDGKTLHQETGSASGLRAAAETDLSNSGPEVLVGKGGHGFILDQPDNAFEQAKAKNRPLLIDFSAIWCPPCNQLDEDVFSSREFQSETSAFVKLKIDVDARENEDLLARYKIAGFPTVIFASSDGDEIMRVAGYRPKAEFLADVREAWKKRAEPFALLAKKAAAGDRAASDRLGLIELERGEYAKALHDLTGTKKYPERRWDAEIGFWAERKGAGDPGAGKKWEDALKKAIAAFPATPDSIQRRTELADAEAGAGDPDHSSQFEALITTARSLIKNPERLKGHDMTVGDLWQTIADAKEKLGRPDEAKQAWKSAAEQYRGQVRSESERGYNLELAYSLWKAGEPEQATRVYETLERNYPSEFTFYYGHARMEYELKRLDAAHDLALKAWKNSYGHNRLKCAMLLAQICKSQNRRREGLSVIREALSEAPSPETSSAAMVARVRALREMAEDLEK